MAQLDFGEITSQETLNPIKEPGNKELELNFDLKITQDDTWVLDRYFDVIAHSENPDQVAAMRDFYKPLFHEDAPNSYSSEINTASLERRLRADRGEDVVSCPGSIIDHRIAAVRHVVRSMVQGNLNFPTERFSEVIDRALDAMKVIDPTPINSSRHVKELHNEVVSTIYYGQDRHGRLRSEAAIDYLSSLRAPLIKRIGKSMLAFVRKQK